MINPNVMPAQTLVSQTLVPSNGTLVEFELDAFFQIAADIVDNARPMMQNTEADSPSVHDLKDLPFAE